MPPDRELGRNFQLSVTGVTQGPLLQTEPPHSSTHALLQDFKSNIYLGKPGLEESQAKRHLLEGG